MQVISHCLYIEDQKKKKQNPKRHFNLSLQKGAHFFLSFPSTTSAPTTHVNSALSARWKCELTGTDKRCGGGCHARGPSEQRWKRRAVQPQDTTSACSPSVRRKEPWHGSPPLKPPRRPENHSWTLECQGENGFSSVQRFLRWPVVWKYNFMDSKMLRGESWITLHHTYVLVLKGQHEPQRKRTLLPRGTRADWCSMHAAHAAACSRPPLIAEKVAKGLFHCCQRKCAEISRDSWQSAVLWTVFLLHLVLVFFAKLNRHLRHESSSFSRQSFTFCKCSKSVKIKCLKAQRGTFLGIDWHQMELKIHISV